MAPWFLRYRSGDAYDRRMRLTMTLAAGLAVACSIAIRAQSLEKEAIVTIAGAAIDRGIVSEIVWDGSTLIVQSAVAEADGRLSAKYYAAPGQGWNCGGSRRSRPAPRSIGT